MSKGLEKMIRLVIYHPVDANHVLAVTGSHDALGNWHEPRRMVLGPVRQRLDGTTGRCWEFTFAVSEAESLGLEYRYLMINQHNDTAIWEREPNRTIHLGEAVDSMGGVIEIVDANFVSDMQFDPVPPSLFIGPYPQLSAHIDLMKACRVTAVLNLQTDSDIQQRRIDWEGLLAHYRHVGIDCQHFPIRDFDEADLVARLPEAVRLLKRLVDAGQQVYIHCTAGMGRSPAVVVTYLSRYHQQNLDEALAYVRRCRPVICPNVNAIRRVLAGEM
jgi:protein-tyrosine phosphatase